MLVGLIAMDGVARYRHEQVDRPQPALWGIGVIFVQMILGAITVMLEESSDHGGGALRCGVDDAGLRDDRGRRRLA